jgi:hypothetical protein
LGVVSAGYSQLTDALIYNWKENTWGHKRLNYGYGFDTANVTLSENLPTWDELGVVVPYLAPNPRMDPGKTWDEQKTGPWNKGVYQPSVPDIVLYQSNDTNTAWWVSVMALNNANYDGTPKTCIATRTGLPIEGASGVVMLREVWPELIGDIPVQISIGGQETLDGAPAWDGPYEFNPDTSTSITPRVTGRFIAIKIESNSVGSWQLGALTLDWALVGER